MTQPDQPEPVAQTSPRDFSGWAVLRGALTSAVAAYFLLTLVIPILISGDPLMALQAIPYGLGYILRLEVLFIGLTLMSALSVVGLIFLVRDKHGYTTYAAAARAGAKTAILVLVVASAVFILPHLAAALVRGNFTVRSPDIAAIMLFAGGSLGTVAVGALSGLAGRLAAGAPRITPAAEAV
jgi:hypothetical protein